MTSDSQDTQSTAAATSEVASDASDPGAEIAAPEALPTFGWNAYAERINGRFAMIGFMALLLLEVITRQDFFTWLGF
ncbi:MAG: chlorophyll a/b-binding protein [Cyanobacteria bacterium P01_D01_bin.6]